MSNHCTGNPAFQTDDADPTNDASCRGSPEATTVRAAELEVFDGAGSWS